MTPFGTAVADTFVNYLINTFNYSLEAKVISLYNCSLKNFSFERCLTKHHSIGFYFTVVVAYDLQDTIPQYQTDPKQYEFSK